MIGLPSTSRYKISESEKLSAGLYDFPGFFTHHTACSILCICAQVQQLELHENGLISVLQEVPEGEDTELVYLSSKFELEQLRVG